MSYLFSTHLGSHICMYMHAIIDFKEKNMNLTETGEGYLTGFGEKKGKGERLQLYCNLKNKNKRGGSKMSDCELQSTSGT